MAQDTEDNNAPKITVTWDDLQTRKVEQRLKEQDALARNRVYAAMDESMVAAPAAAQPPSGVATLWRNTIFAMALFGLIGGVLAWGCGTLLEFKPDMKVNALERLSGVKNLADLYERDLRAAPGGEHQRVFEADSDFAITQAIAAGVEENPYFAVLIRHDEAEIRKRQLYAIAHAKDAGVLTAKQAEDAATRIRENQKNNPYFAVFTDEKLDAAAQQQQFNNYDRERDQKLDVMNQQEQTKALVANILAFGVRGVILAVLLAIAIPLTESNFQAAIVNGSVGAALGLLGGVAAAFATAGINKLVENAPPDSAPKFLATVAVWGAMGLFLTLAPGVVMRNPKKLAIGLTGGLIGGLIGGVLFEPLRGSDALEHNSRIAELVAMISIGLLSGLATGLIEDVAKTGWVKVVQGLIAGKQFILYRNPTFIGAGPDCQIYLFKDPKVGKRHAAIHIVGGGYELEDLPLGSETLVNGKPSKRTRLRNGDRIQVGATQLVFMEKASA